MLSQLRGASPCSAAGDSRFRHRVWAGLSPAELVIKSSPWPTGWRQSSHRSATALSGLAGGVSNCGGNHAEVLPNITRHVGSSWATAGALDWLHSGCAHSSVLPKTNRHEVGELAAADITTSVAEQGAGGSVARPGTARYRPNGPEGGKARAQAPEVVKRTEDARGESTASTLVHC